MAPPPSNHLMGPRGTTTELFDTDPHDFMHFSPIHQIYTGPTTTFVNVFMQPGTYNVGIGYTTSVNSGGGGGGVGGPSAGGAAGTLVQRNQGQCEGPTFTFASGTPTTEAVPNAKHPQTPFHVGIGSGYSPRPAES